MFWEKFEHLSEVKGIKSHVILKELEISSGSANNWKKDTIPNGETLTKIADYFDVSVDYLLGRTDLKDICKTTKEDWRTAELMALWSKFDKRTQLELLVKAYELDENGRL